MPAIEPDRQEAEGSVAGTVLEREQRAELLDALGTLSPADREMVALKFFAGLNNVEIAEATGYSPTNVGTRLSRAMNRLRSAMETDVSTSNEEVAK